MKIAILGATGYIGRSLVYELSLETKDDIFLFGRSRKKLNDLLKIIVNKKSFKANNFDKFKNFKYDVVINCVGIGNPAEMNKSGFKIFEITEKFDNLVLNYLKKNPECIYINLSSGAAYGKKIEKPVKNETYSSININKLDQGDNYTISKINSEAKHRILSEFNIVDLRVFSFFSRFIELGPGYLISDIIISIKNKSVLLTAPEDIVRDYVNPSDLLNLIKLLIKKKNINEVFDVYTLKPVSKFELLNYLKKKYGLRFEIKKSSVLSSPTGLKNAYYSNNKKAKDIGYKPTMTSLQGIEREIISVIKK
ncbi:MAG: NAD(P)-dependent oxidoreductase [Parcubacteria group bacterium]|jgi:nucleoside-diphosphate-sugar epimerase